MSRPEFTSTPSKLLSTSASLFFVPSRSTEEEGEKSAATDFLPRETRRVPVFSESKTYLSFSSAKKIRKAILLLLFLLLMVVMTGG